MATVSERIRLIFDVDSNAAVGSFGHIRKSIDEADGARGKFQAGLRGTGQFLKANMAEAATAAATAIAAFGVLSVKKFQETALQAGKMSDALGISSEQASRLMEVSGDLGIDIGSLQGAMQRLNREAADGKLGIKGLGDTIVTAKDGTVDAYESFIQTATAIGAIEDPTKRAEAAQRVFGRSYGEIAELMEMDAEELRTALANVSDQKVIDDDEQRKAREFRAAMDAMKDTVEDVQMQFGELLVQVAPVLIKLTELTGDSVSKLADMYKAVEDIAYLVAGEDSDPMAKMAVSAEQLNATLKDLGYETKVNERELAGLGETTRRTETEVRDLETAWRELKGEFDDRASYLNLQDDFDAIRTKAQEAWTAAAEGAADAEQKLRDYERAQLDTKSAVADYAREVLGLPVEVVTRILATDNFDEIEQRLAILTRNRTVSLDIQARGGVGYDVPINGRRAAGGPVAPGGAYLVGENGPEILQMGSQGGNVVPNHALGGSSVINVYTQSNPNDVIRAIKAYERVNGTGWRR